jgi:hypothetical protein
MQTVADQVNELHDGQGRLLREVADYNTTAKTVDNAILARLERVEDGLKGLREEIHDWIRPRIESMRPKMESIRDSMPMLVEESATKVVRQAMSQQELDALREGRADRKMLKMETYKVVIGAAVVATLGVLSGIVLNALSVLHH